MILLCSIRKQHRALPSQAVPAGAALATLHPAAKSKCESAEWEQARWDLLVPRKEEKVENDLEEGAAGRDVMLVVELPLLKHSNCLMAPSPRSSHTLPLHISSLTRPRVLAEIKALFPRRALLPQRA